MLEGILLFFVLPAVFVALGIVTCVKAPSCSGFEITGAIIWVISAGILLIMVITWPCCYLEEKAFVEEFKAVEATVQGAREGAPRTEGETTALTILVSTVNAKLAEKQYYASIGVFDMFYPDEILELEPIR